MAGALLGLCLTLAAGAAAVFVPGERFTLAWVHSIEKTRWEEDYVVRRDDGGVALLAVAARIKGSGAGMEPPPDAQWRDGWYVWRPATPRIDVLRLSRSAFVPDYELCVDAQCRPLSEHLPSDGGVTLVVACDATRRGAGAGQ